MTFDYLNASQVMENEYCFVGDEENSSLGRMMIMHMCTWNIFAIVSCSPNSLPVSMS